MPDLNFCSLDRRFGLSVPSRVVDGILSVCGPAGPSETGGVLVGHYSKRHDCALVTSFSGPPSDSKAGPTWFERGVTGIGTWLKSLWIKQADYYLGEWHFHPGGAPVMSPRDIEEMSSISRSRIYKCPEPVLLIIGGIVPDKWHPGAYVFPKSGTYLELKTGSRSPKHRKQLKHDKRSTSPN